MTEISATVEHEDADLANMGQKNRELHGRLTALQQDKTSAELKLAEANHALESVGGKGEEAKQSALLQRSELLAAINIKQDNMNKLQVILYNFI